jgi:alpha-ketoglutarate-dependent taurine dioxygenase
LPPEKKGMKMDSYKTYFLNSAELPLVIESSNTNLPMEELVLILKEHNHFFKKQLLKYGGLLFRNFPIQNEDDFSCLIKNLNTGTLVDYIGGDSPRKKIKEGIYTSTEAPPSLKIPLHNELSFNKNYPSHIYFYCHTAPIEKGETIIADARKVYQSIDEEVKNRFIEKKLKYISSYPGKNKFINFINKYHKTWMEVFEAANKEEVEKKCKENGYAFQWVYNDWLKISQVRPAVNTHPITQEKVWFNQAHIFDFNPKFLGWLRYMGVKLVYCQEDKQLHQVFFADNLKIPRKDIYHILDVLDANTLSFPWQKGDVLVLDNILTMHGRAPFQGKRRVLAAMTKETA